MPLWPALTVLFGPLYAVVGPQRLRAVIDLDGLEAGQRVGADEKVVPGGCQSRVRTICGKSRAS